MPTPDETRRALSLVTTSAVREAHRVLDATNTVDELVEAIPLVVSVYSDGTAALAADHYDDLRDLANPPGRRFVAEPVVNLRDEKIRRGVLWAAEPLRLETPERLAAKERLAQVVSLESARPFRDTILDNHRRDPASVGWRRQASLDGCKFCRMLAANGAVYKQSTARFASHPHCSCSASPVFDGEPGTEASVLQYVASQRRRTDADRARLNAYLASLPD